MLSIFSCVCFPSVYLPYKNVDSVFPFFNQAAWFFYVELYDFFIYFDINSLVDISSADIISNSVIYIFVLLIVSFTVQRIFFFFPVVLGLHCCMWALSSCRATLHCSAQASHCSGFSCCGTDSRHTGFSGCSTLAQQLRLAGSRAQA